MLISLSLNIENVNSVGSEIVAWVTTVSVAPETVPGLWAFSEYLLNEIFQTHSIFPFLIL